MPKFLTNAAQRLLPLASLLLVAMPAQAREAARVPVTTDHHMHVHSPAMLEFLPIFCAALPTGKCEGEFTAPRTIDELIAAMNHAGIEHGLLVSSGYLAESAFIKPAPANGPAVLRGSNDFTVDAARAHPSRLKALIAINPLTPTALPEIERWRADRNVAGIKLHLTNSGFDFRRSEDVAKLVAVFRAAARNRMAILVHMRTIAPDYGRQDAEIFIRDVLPAAQGAYVQIAHAAGWGGISEHTISALGAFADAFDRRPRAMRNVYFDLAAVIDKSNPADRQQALAALIRRIGARHFLPASDYPFALDLRDYYERVYPTLPLSEREWRILRGNVAPYARSASRRAIR
ncbi:MAG: amidohydrolase [Sphingomonadales bacterium]|nr:MAG: amidohydrolase [Sphingomonadales bacterium]